MLKWPMPHLIALLVVVVGPVLLIQHLTGLSFGLAAVVAVVLVVVGIYAFKERVKRRRAVRRAALTAKYGSPEEADMILDARIWTGMSADQLLDALGRPEDVDHAVTARKVSEVWKYGRIGQNRYRNRVTVNDGRVAGWTARRG